MFLHVIRVLAVRIVLSLGLVDEVAEIAGVEVDGCTIGDANVKGGDSGAKELGHLGLRLYHKLGGNTELTVGTKDGEAGDVAVSFGGIFFELCEHIADDVSLRVLRHEEQLWPREDVIEVVLDLHSFFIHITVEVRAPKRCSAAPEKKE